MVQRGLSTEVMLALLEAPPSGVDGLELQQLLGRHGRSARSDLVLSALLRLEGSDLVRVERGDRYSFALTDRGRDRAIELGGGRPVHVRLVMADLVDFVSFTAAHGDAAAHDAARTLTAAARRALREHRGEVVKELGDGVLAWMPAGGDGVAVARELARSCQRPDGAPWMVRAATHVGNPIKSGGDLFGADVNLVARLCDLAEPGQLVATVDPATNGHGSAERVEVRGVEGPIAINRTALT